VLGVVGRVSQPGAQASPAAGVIGLSDAGGAGVLAANAGGGLALDVSGQARFSSAGHATVPADQSSVHVRLPGITATSTINVTPMTNPPHGISLRWVERQPGVGFVIHLNNKTSHPVEFSYLAAESPAAG
jgi:hypothetical protein